MARQRRFLSRGPRRETDWGEGPGSSGVISISGSATTIIGSGMVITVGASTLVRLRVVNITTLLPLVKALGLVPPQASR